MTVEVDTGQLRSAGRRLQAIGEPLARKNEELAKTLEPQWSDLLRARASTGLERRVIGSTGRLVAVDGGLRPEAGKTGGALRGGLSIAAAAGPAEHGGNPGARRTYSRKSKRGRVHQVTRRTQAQFRSANKAGYVFGPAVKVFLPNVSDALLESLRSVVSESLGGK